MLAGEVDRAAGEVDRAADEREVELVLARLHQLPVDRQQHRVQVHLAAPPQRVVEHAEVARRRVAQLAAEHEERFAVDVELRDVAGADEVGDEVGHVVVAGGQKIVSRLAGADRCPHMLSS